MEPNYKYKSLQDFKKVHPNLYNWLASKKLLKQLCVDMGWKYVIKHKSYDLKKIIKTTENYNSYSQWRKYEQATYRLAVRYKLTDKICEEKNWSKRLPNKHWTRENCIKEAKKYKTYVEWNKNSSGSTSAAWDNKWVKECIAHMVPVKNPNNYWTKEKCLEEAKKYETRKEWRINSKGSWSAANRLKIYKECTEHMTIIKTWKKTK
jgi:3-keto-L-gulonate-6-phosphate decarboxylase